MMSCAKISNCLSFKSKELSAAALYFSGAQYPDRNMRTNSVKFVIIHHSPDNKVASLLNASCV